MSFTDVPWESIAGFLATVGLLGALFGKWIPFVRNIIESTVRWLGGMFTAELSGRVDHLSGRVEFMINRFEEHAGQEGHPQLVERVERIEERLP